MARVSMSLDNVDGILLQTMGELHWMLNLYGRWIEKKEKRRKKKKLNATPVCVEEEDDVEIITHKSPWIRVKLSPHRMSA